jgi:dTDP-4-dehydrorhamnose 3,5-epimerase
VIFRETELPGVMVVELEPYVDERGVFTRTFDAQAFAEAGVSAQVIQCSNSLNTRAGTLRGMHYQLTPHAEGKLVRCVKGGIYDVVVDLRRESPTHGCWFAAELTDANMLCMLLPEGVAHGFQTLADDTEVHYQMTAAYVPEASRGVRWDDPVFSISWPEPPGGERIVSARDRSFPDYEP